MRHTFSTIAMGAALSVSLLTACSSEDSFEAQPTVPTEQTNTPVAFGSYLGRSVSTRGDAYLQTKDIALNGKIGLYAMYTKGNKFNLTTGTFEDNFMQNFQLYSSLTDDELKNAEADKIAESWVYSPLRYWPMTSEEYLSFMAYAPFNQYAQLADANGETSGSLTYLKHEVEADPANQIDLLYADPSGITNMQLYATDATGNGTTWTHSGDFYGLDGQTSQTSESVKDKRAPLVNLKFKHATARIGFVVTSSALKAEGNYPYTVTTTTTDETTGEETTTTENKTAKAGDETTETKVDGKMSITVNKVELLGDNTTANAENPTGAFYPSAYVNLESSSAADLWSQKATDGKLAFTYDNTSTERTVTGEYKSDGDGTITTTSAKYTWLPSDLNGGTKTASKTITGTWETEPVTDEEGNPTSKNQFKAEPTIGYIGNGASDYMFVIPQEFTDAAPLYVYLDFTLNDGDGNSQEFKVYRPIVKNFEAGKSYIIKMDISTLTAIQFSVELDNWSDEILVPTDPQF